MQSPLLPVHPGAQLSAGAQAKPDISRTIITNFAIDLPPRDRSAGQPRFAVPYCSVTEDTACSTKVCKPRRCVGMAPCAPFSVGAPSSAHPTDTGLRALAGPQRTRMIVEAIGFG